MAPNRTTAIVITVNDNRCILMDGTTLQIDNSKLKDGARRLLSQTSRLGLPVSLLTLDGVILDVTMPLIAPVVGIQITSSGRLSVAFEGSVCERFIDQNRSDFSSARALLRQSLATQQSIVVIEDDEHNIIEVQAADARLVFRNLTRKPYDSPPPLPKEISAAKAKSLFDLVSRKSCAPNSQSEKCIPFLYPDDGCFARASAICRIALEEGLAPQKMWSFGFILVQTPNTPLCQLRWRFHVAPILLVGRTREWMVIDPSLFSNIVEVERWRKQQGQTVATLRSSADFYCPTADGTFNADNNYKQTDYDLNFFGTKLLERCLSPVGPPPYQACI